ncbi:MAG: DNA-directed RNA polymerase subunit alpha [Patescibacteria group bacterium]
MTTTINTPNLTAIDEHSAASASFVIEPLMTGYGMTLGNSLRRVLLSSISGAAVIAFKVDGASHEFTTLKGVKEDVVEIMLNLKGLRFRVHSESDEPVLVSLSKKGKGTVTGKDVTSNSEVEVVNKDHVIATLDGASDSLTIELLVSKGRGYQTNEQSAKAKPSDMIALDALFSPIMRVRYKVDSTRVGQKTELDKLNITIDTDGTITPKDAFEEASAILQSQYEALAGATVVESASFVDQQAAEDSDGENGDDPEELLVSVEDLNLSARTTNALINNDIHNLKDLFSLTDVEMKELKGFGSKALDEVRDKLAELEL